MKAGEPFGEIESVKAVSDLYSPVDGEVVEVNAHWPTSWRRFSDDPYGDGWIVKIKLSDEAGLAEPDGLTRPIEKQCAEEGH